MDLARFRVDAALSQYGEAVHAYLSYATNFKGARDLDETRGELPHGRGTDTFSDKLSTTALTRSTPRTEEDDSNGVVAVPNGVVEAPAKSPLSGRPPVPRLDLRRSSSSATSQTTVFNNGSHTMADGGTNGTTGWTDDADVGGPSPPGLQPRFGHPDFQPPKITTAFTRSNVGGVSQQPVLLTQNLNVNWGERKALLKPIPNYLPYDYQPVPNLFGAPALTLGPPKNDVGGTRRFIRAIIIVGF